MPAAGLCAARAADEGASPERCARAREVAGSVNLEFLSSALNPPRSPCEETGLKFHVCAASGSSRQSSCRSLVVSICLLWAGGRRSLLLSIISPILLLALLHSVLSLSLPFSSFLRCFFASSSSHLVPLFSLAFILNLAASLSILLAGTAEQPGESHGDS